MANKYIHAIGRRKTASAQVRLFEGTGACSINAKEISVYITRQDLFDVAFLPIKLTSLKDKVYFEVKVE
jgi:small subunit ribosomal protein S9